MVYRSGALSKNQTFKKFKYSNPKFSDLLPTVLLIPQITPFTQISIFLKSLKQPSYFTPNSETAFITTQTLILKNYYPSPSLEIPLEDSSDNGLEIL